MALLAFHVSLKYHSSALLLSALDVLKLKKQVMTLNSTVPSLPLPQSGSASWASASQPLPRHP